MFVRGRVCGTVASASVSLGKRATDQRAAFDEGFAANQRERSSIQKNAARNHNLGIGNSGAEPVWSGASVGLEETLGDIVF
jgi:hypothetical protein